MIIYNGPSELDGQPIVVIATDNSKNVKTGAMVQLWILRSDINPIEAVKTGADASICGNCPHRGTSCYVNLHHAPLSIFRAFQRGRYQTLTDYTYFTDRHVRLGAYGDPAAIPQAILNQIVHHAKATTGYTHQWRKAQHLSNCCMASVDSPEQRDQAKQLGFRTFRVRTAEQPKLKLEVTCPASEEGGKKLTCNQCLACSGTGRKGDIVIQVHGIKSKVKAFTQRAA